MSEEKTEAPAEEIIQETVTVETTETTEVVEEIEAEAKPTEEEKKVEEAKKRSSEKTQKRINKLTRRAKEAETKTVKLEAELSKYQKPVEPDPDNYESQDDYIKAKVTFEVNKTKPQEVVPQAFDINPTLESGREKYADFDAIVLDNKSLAFSQEMAEMISEADNGDDIFYHLGKNPVELERISLLSTKEQARELGRLEARLSMPKPRTTQTPKPVTPLDESGAQTPDRKNESMASYAARRNKEQYG